MQLREFMKRDVITISPDSTVVEAAQVMGEHNIGCLVVARDKMPKGILTDRDIVLKVIARGGDPGRTRVTDIMQTHIISATPETDVLDASRLMSTHRIRRLPIEEDGRLVGIISITDLGRVVKEELDNLFSLRAAPVYH